MNFQFQYNSFWWAMLALPVFALLFVLLIVWKKRVKKRMGDARLVDVLTSGFSQQLFAAKFVLLSAGFALGVISLVNPRKPGAADNITHKGIDVVIAMDVSKSMLATDLAPSRLERAKQFISKLMNTMPDDRIGLVLFAGKAYLQMPLTIDHQAAQLFVSSADPSSVPQQGTVISDALKMSLNAFNNTGERYYKAIVLISDGEDHDEEAIKTAKNLAQQAVMINTVGVGSPEGANIIDPETGQNKQDEAGNPILSKLNEDELKQLAEKTNGTYIRLQSSDEAVRVIKKQLSQIESKSFNDVSLINYKTYFMWFAGAMLLFLLIEQFIPEQKIIKA